MLLLTEKGQTSFLLTSLIISPLESVQKSLENHFQGESIPIKPSEAFMSRIAVRLVVEVF